ncbi:hypothetical protein BKA70DRAFT_1566655 [Coprinopsis sp. MPI-PUGE-AT-0042]|nr:hypothetical protein BKA70DRAFT_1566655 [Coprinopsis sp. MPI-PUGE-AT-0042]
MPRIDFILAVDRDPLNIDSFSFPPFLPPPHGMKLAASLLGLIGALTVAHAALMPRASPTPCSQRYVCPTPVPYPQTPDTGDSPGPNRFKCRIGQSAGDPNFAFCVYEKNTGNLVGSTPSNIQGFCWEKGMPNPECASQPGRRALPTRHPNTGADQPVPGDKVAIKRFSRRE